MGDQCVIEELLTNKFSCKSFQEKLEIVKNGRPRPELTSLTSEHECQKKEYTRHFSLQQYTSVPWLTGCEHLNKLFCWPCLLFSNDDDVWTKIGLSNFCHMHSAQLQHERSQSHIDSFVKYKLFGKQKTDSMIESLHLSYVDQQNEQVNKNRKIFKRLIDAICFLSKQKLPLRLHNETEESCNKGNYLELLELLRSYDPLLDIHLKTASVSSVFNLTSSSVQNIIIHAVSNVILDEIKNEITASPFVSIMLDETSNIMSISRLSTVLRYIKDGVSHERFIGFTDISSDRTVRGLFNHVTKVVNEFKIGSKLVGQSYDGASVMGCHLKKLKSNVLEAYPKALFTHCYAHDLNLVLQQGLSNIKECRKFFNTLNALTAFFSHSIDRRVALQYFVDKNSSISPNKLNFTSRSVHTVKEYSKILVEFFEFVVTNANEWDTDSTVKARGFIVFLEDFETVFLLRVFSKLFSCTDAFHNALQNTFIDTLHCTQMVNDIIRQLQSDRRYSFDTLFSIAVAQNKNDLEPKAKRGRYEFLITYYRRLYCQIIDNVSEQIKSRYSSFSKLAFMHLLSFVEFDGYKNTFPNYLINNMKLTYGDMFDYILLKRELSVIYASPEFRKMPILELLSYLKNNDLKTPLKEVYKLAELVLTIPSTKSSVKRSFSALNRIHSHIRNNQSGNVSSNLSLISIEKDLLNELQLKDNFYDLVIEKFLMEEKRIPLKYIK